MALRTIMIFPKFKNIAEIDKIGKKYDPLAKLVKPHITMVFPFVSIHIRLHQLMKNFISIDSSNVGIYL